MIEVGQKAPDFKLLDPNKNEFTLENFRGKNLIIFFFPMAWTGACTKEMCAIQEDYNMYKNMDIFLRNTLKVNIFVYHFTITLTRYLIENN